MKALTIIGITATAIVTMAVGTGSMSVAAGIAAMTVTLPAALVAFWKSDLRA